MAPHHLGCLPLLVIILSLLSYAILAVLQPVGSLSPGDGQGLSFELVLMIPDEMVHIPKGRLLNLHCGATLESVRLAVYLEGLFSYPGVVSRD